MEITGLDHIVLSCRCVPDMVAFYRNVLGLRTGEERPGKWAIWFGAHKISLQDEANKPELAAGTSPGSGNFCLPTDTDIDEIAGQLEAMRVEILARGRRQGATGPLESLYFRDPEGNLVELANAI